MNTRKAIRDTHYLYDSRFPFMILGKGGWFPLEIAFRLSRRDGGLAPVTISLMAGRLFRYYFHAVLSRAVYMSFHLGNND